MCLRPKPDLKNKMKVKPDDGTYTRHALLKNTTVTGAGTPTIWGGSSVRGSPVSRKKFNPKVLPFSQARLFVRVDSSSSVGVSLFDEAHNLLTIRAHRDISDHKRLAQTAPCLLLTPCTRVPLTPPPPPTCQMITAMHDNEHPLPRRADFDAHRAVVLKLIRLRDGLSAPACEASGLKLLHLVRDPRAVVRSQLGTFGFKVAKKWDPLFDGWNSLSNEAAEKRAHRVLANQ